MTVLCPSIIPDESAVVKQGVEKPQGFFYAKEETCASLKFFGISGRLTDLWYNFFHQCAHWFQKYVPGAQVAGNDEA